MKVFRELKKNQEYLNSRLPIGSSFDMVGRDMSVGKKRGYLVFIDGFAKDDIMVHVLKALQPVDLEPDIPDFMARLVTDIIPYLEAEENTDFDQLELFLLSGSLILFVDGEASALIIDARTYPVRGIDEADTEKVTNGSKDGFVETLVFNTSLIRRRVRNRNLCFELKTVGRSSKTDVSLAYIKGKADEDFIRFLREKLDHIEVESLVMAEKSLEELLVKRKWYNPLPQIRYTQRPDIAASYLEEGHVLVMVDTSPSVMITPSTFFYFTEYAEDYNQIPIVGTHYKFVRHLCILTALLLLPTWFLLAANPDSLPEYLSFIGVREEGSFSLLIQFLILEFGFDLLKMSAMHTPTYLGGTFGIIGGLLLGDYAIKVGFFVPETIFYMAVTLVASYCIPNSDLTYAIRILRLFLLILTGILGVYGYIGGLAAVVLLLLTTKTLDRKRPYLWPLVPFDGAALSNLLFRKKVSNKR